MLIAKRFCFFSSGRERKSKKKKEGVPFLSDEDGEGKGYLKKGGLSLH